MSKSLRIAAWVGLATLAAGIASPFHAVPPGAPVTELDTRVERAALGIYVHGMTAEIARDTVGAQGVPVLLRLLQDPAFPRRDNVVAYLAYLGDDRATPDLLALYRTAHAGFSRPEDFRAALIGVEALGRIAGRGGVRARQALLDALDERGAGGFVGAAYRAGRIDDRLRAALYESSVRALALSGDPALGDRLDALVAGGEGPVPDVDFAATAREQAESAIAPSPVAVAPAPQPTFPPRSPRAIDPAPRCDESFLTYANHADLTNAMTDGRLDADLSSSNLAAGTDDGSDTACCVRLARDGGAGSWSTPGQDVITSASEIQAVLGNPVARVKVVASIQYCGGPGTNIIGCAPVGGYGMAVVRLSTELGEGLLWMHEYGHNTGLGHNPSTGYIMSGGLTLDNTRLTGGECGQFHSPSGGAQATIVDCGVCEDADGNGVVSSVDNCPGGQPGADDDGDGVGGSCDCAPGDQEVFSTPGGIDSLILAPDGADLVLSWQTPPSAGQSVRYQIVRSALPGDWNGATCAGLTGATSRRLVGELDDPGLAFYFVRGVNFCGTTLDDGLGGQASVPAGVCG